MSTDKTITFDKEDLTTIQVRQTLDEVYEILDSIGYNATQQIIGYLVSGDLGYISSHKDARKKMARLDKEQILEVLLEGYLKNK